MGYLIYKINSKFIIKFENQEKALLALKSLANKEKYISYVENDNILKSKNLYEAMKEFGWALQFEKDENNPLSIDKMTSILKELLNKSKNNNLNKIQTEAVLEKIINRLPKDKDVIDLKFENEYAGSDKLMFDTIAPYVESGSFIEMGSDDGKFRWTFSNNRCEEITPKINW